MPNLPCADGIKGVVTPVILSPAQARVAQGDETAERQNPATPPPIKVEKITKTC